LERAAAAIADAWANGSEESGEAGERENTLVIRSLAAIASEAANQVFARLQDVARNLAKALDTAGRALGAEAGPDEEEFVALVKEMPQPDLGTLEIQIRRDFLRFLGKSATAARVRRKFEQQIGQRVSEGLRSYGRMLEAWSRRTLSQLHQHFDAYGDGYRAQLERLAGGSRASSEESEVLRQELMSLARFEKRGASPSPFCQTKPSGY
jgi:hypothetical protein